MSDISPFPRCGAPAEITERFWLDSTDGPIQHLKIGCLSKHWLIPLAKWSRRSRSPPRFATWRRCRADRTRYCQRSRRAAPEAW